MEEIKAVAEPRVQERAGSALRSWAEDLERNHELDAIAAQLDGIATSVVGSGRRRDLLRGRWLGHSLHPVLTDFPLGSWIGASVLDLFAGRDAREAAQRLVGFGVLAALPTALAGMADWRDTSGGARRVGVAHASLNAGILGCYAASWAARRRGHHRTGIGLAVVGGTAAWVSGYLGGHLSLVKKTGIENRDRRVDPPLGRDEKTERGPMEPRDQSPEKGKRSPSEPVVHGGEGDPLGGGVAELDDDERVSEGVPDQAAESPERDNRTDP